MKTRHYMWAIFAVLLLTAVNASGQTTKSPLPPPTGHVNDYAGVINRATKTELETTLTNLDREQKIQFAVVVVDTTSGQDIFDYSRDVARGWGVGSKDTTKPSLLLLVAIKDRKYFTQVSRHLEGDLPDGLAGQIQREKLVPAFRESDYSGGVRETINEYIRTVARKQGFSTDKIFAPGASAPRTRETRPKAGFCVTLIVLGVIALVILGLVAAARRGGMGGPGGGGSGGWLGWLLLSMLLSGRSGSSSSGWSGGGFGGFSGGGGGGGGFGGFGGGGDFGGGGAGGSW
ncbi:MAG TPA: TPM domain-containing protein [Pyrinomonadaceae bacterium]